jgi:hypothetical protein
MNFGVKENFMIFSHLFGVVGLKRVGLNVRILTYAEDVTALVINDSSNIEFFTHFIAPVI